MSSDPTIALRARDAESTARELAALRADYGRATFDLHAAQAEVAELRRTRDALRESEARLADVFRLSPSFMCVLGGPRHVYELANELYCEFVGRRDLIGLSVFEAFPEIEYQAFPQLLDDVYRTGVPFVGTDVTVVLRRGSGGPLVESSIDLVYQALRDPDGSVTGVFVQGIDLTARKRAERQLARAADESERERRLLHTALSNTADFLYTFDLAGRFTYANDALLNLWGKTSAEALGKNFHELDYPPELADRLQRQIGEVIATRRPVRDETRFTGPLDRRQREYEYILVPVIGASGAAEAVVGSTRDTTDRRQADDLRRDHQFFHALIDALSSNIAVLDEVGVILAVNDAWRRFADVNHHGIPDYGVGRNYFGGISPFQDAEARLVVEGFRDVLSGRRPVFEMEYPCHSPTEQRWFVMRVTRFKSPGPVRVVVSHEDVTPRKLSEFALADANRRKDEFLATLAHELRNPLAPLRNGLEVLKVVGHSAEASEKVRGMMERQLAQMVRLVDDLLDISRINSGKLELRRQRVDLAEVLRNAVETSRPLIDRHGHVLTVTLPADPVYLDADPVRLAQAFVNLLNNAAKYSEAGGLIGVSAEAERGAVAVRVRDAGIGIAPGQLAGVFDMFAQVQTALEKSEGGLGIGLSLVKGLVAMHGGTVEVASAGLGHGSEFVVRLPVAAGAPADAPAAAPEPPPRGAGRRVLIVDDNVDSAESLGELLGFAGHDARTAHDGLAGVAAAEAFRPDVIVMDLGMPKLNGYEAARRIRVAPWGATVLLVAQTGWGSAEDRRKTADAGFDYHLVKPISPAVLLELLASC